MNTTAYSLTHRNGFTLTEVMIAVVLFSISIGTATGVLFMCQKMWHATSLSMQTAWDCNLAMSRLIYGVGTNNGLRTATTITISSNATGWRITCPNPFDGTAWIDFNRPASNIYWGNSLSSQMIGDHVYAPLPSVNSFGVNITLIVYRAEGQFTSTNRISTFIKKRNQ